MAGTLSEDDTPWLGLAMREHSALVRLHHKAGSLSDLCSTGISISDGGLIAYLSMSNVYVVTLYSKQGPLNLSFAIYTQVFHVAL